MLNTTADGLLCSNHILVEVLATSWRASVGLSLKYTVFRINLVRSTKTVYLVMDVEFSLLQ